MCVFCEAWRDIAELALIAVVVVVTLSQKSYLKRLKATENTVDFLQDKASQRNFLLNGFYVTWKFTIVLFSSKLFEIKRLRIFTMFLRTSVVSIMCLSLYLLYCMAC